jgi:hypothetical protein
MKKTRGRKSRVRVPLNGTSGSPDSWAKAVLNIDSNLQRNSIRFDYKNRLRAMLQSAESTFFVR